MDGERTVLQLLVELAQPWRKDAACISKFDDPAYDWFPSKYRSYPAQAAKAVCRGCPVRQDCLQYALDQDERGGIWGGLNAAERWDLLVDMGLDPGCSRDEYSRPRKLQEQPG